VGSPSLCPINLQLKPATSPSTVIIKLADLPPAFRRRVDDFVADFKCDRRSAATMQQVCSVWFGFAM
jgi:hypothetical protein